MQISLSDRYEIEHGRIFLSGIQALVRLPLEQLRQDRHQGLRTRAFVTGYPGSPLGGYDIALGQARTTLERHGVVHLPGQNEELAATTLIGTQMLDEHPHPDADGVVAYWYGKGPGVDRSGDAFKHGNFAGTSTHGAVVILSGEDHEAKSSTVPYQQEFAFEHFGIPVLYPASVQEFIEYGLHAAAISRYSGCWVALKLVGPLCDGGEVVRIESPDTRRFKLPQLEFGGRPFRKRSNFLFFPVVNIETERELYDERHAAVRAYAALNGLNRVTLQARGDRIGIVAAGKSYTDTLQALQDLGLDDAGLHAAGIRLARIGLLHPLDRAFVRDFARGLDTVVVVEEKRDYLERQVGRVLCDVGPIRLLGKHDANGRVLFPTQGGMNSDTIAKALGGLLLLEGLLSERGVARLAQLSESHERQRPAAARRTLNFCSGCPHNVSTKLAPGQIAWGAPGCHIIAAVMDRPERRIEAVTQLGGEGLPWIGLAPFCDRRHIVQNVGDGALLHSSYQNIRFAVSAGVNITFRILYNGVIANTGGQASIGAPSVENLLARLALEGVARIVLIASDPKRYRASRLPKGVVVRGVDALETSLEELAGIAGTTVLIHDGECANERRRRRKRGRLAPATRFTVVNEDVCENCGECGQLANCMSLQKIETGFGARTQIHQSSCNQDQACVRADCPSFVTVEVDAGAGLRQPPPCEIDASTIPGPRLPVLSGPYRICVPGLGGTGVLTANAILATAASLDGSEVRSYDQTGAAQKWGAVWSSLVVSAPGQVPITNQIGVGRADVYLALDLFAAVDPQNLSRCDPGVTRAVINSGVLPNGEMIRDPRRSVPADAMIDSIRAASSGVQAVVVDARRIAESLFGDYLMSNMVCIGVAWQAGMLPISAAGIEAAIRINGTQVERNIAAFRAGRLWQHEPARLAPMLDRRHVPLSDRLEENEARHTPRSRARLGVLLERFREAADGAGAELVACVESRAADLIRYQHEAYARRYLGVLEVVARRERAAMPGEMSFTITDAVARSLHKLMAYKDEYEVARLLSQEIFVNRVRAMFTGTARLSYHLHPPLLRPLGVRGKVRFGPWFVPVLRALARLRFLRGTALDPFGRLAVRRAERELVGWYVGLVEQCTRELTPATLAIVHELASLPEQIRGYEQVKLDSIARAKAQVATLVERLQSGTRSSEARVVPESVHDA